MMKLIFKILFFVIAIFQTNISEARVIVFDGVASKIQFSVGAVESKNNSKQILQNDFAIICKSESILLDYRSWAVSVEAQAAKGMTDAQLLTRIAQKAETAIGGSGGVAGTLKHTYAKNLLSRYQSIYGDRGLSVGSNYFNGPAGKGFLDVVNHNTKIIYDFKFGNAFMSNAQYLKYSNSFPGYGIQVIKP